MITNRVGNVSNHSTIYQGKIRLRIPKRMVRPRVGGQSPTPGLHQAIHCQFRHQLVQNPRRTRLGLHLQKVPDSHNRVDNTTMMSYSKASAIHSLWPMYFWAGEFSSPNKWSGGHWSSLSLPLTSTSVLSSFKNTARNFLICATSEKSFTWAEREIKYSENAIKYSIHKTSDFIQLIQVHLNYSPSFLYHFLSKK